MLKRLLGTLQRPTKLNASGVAHHLLLAFLIVGAVAGFGAYRVLYSDASTNYAAQKEACRDRYPNNQNARQNCVSNVNQQKAADEAAAAEEAKKKTVNCAAQNRQQKDAYTCGGCQAGYFDKDGSCKQRQTVNCAAQNRQQKDEYSCGGCIGGWYDKNGTCTQMNKKDCSAENRQQEADNKCGGCKAGWYDKNGVCTQMAKKNCAAENRQQKDDYTCGGCVAGWSDKYGTCIKINSGSTNQQDSGTNNNTAKSKRAECAAANLQYNEKSNSCGNCVAGYFMKDGSCKKMAENNNQQSNVNASNNVTCAANQKYDKNAKACVCVEGFTKADKGVCTKLLTSEEECALNGSGDCLEASRVKQICEEQKRKYVRATNACANVCVNDNFHLTGNVCVKKSTEPVKDVKAACEAAALRYDAATNRCATQCRATYVMRDGNCVLWTETDMTKWRCSALGREWFPATEEQATGTCVETCVNPTTTKFVNTGNANTSFCKANANVLTVDGVTVGIGQDECIAQNRVWIGAIEACTARCQTGWFLNDGACAELQTVSSDGTPLATGDGATGGCEDPIQDARVASEGDASVDVTVCPSDEPVGEPAETTSTDPVTHATEVLMDRQTCALLGRVWVPNANVAGEKVRGGCSNQECRQDGSEVRRSNGSAYCEGSVDRISLEECTAAHRVWIPRVNGCAARAGVSDKKTTKVNAAQCEAPFTVYVHYTTAEGEVDECLKPGVFQRLQGIAETAGKPVSYVVSLAPQGLCKLQQNKEWIDGQCVKKRLGAEKGDKISTDSFGNKFNMSEFELASVKCSDMKAMTSSDANQQYICAGSDLLCKNAGGNPVLVYRAKATNGETVVSSANVCWKGDVANEVTISDSFGQTANASVTDYDAVDCQKFHDNATDEQREGFDCTKKAECKANGGTIATRYLYLSEAQRMLGANVCVLA